MYFGNKHKNKLQHDEYFRLLIIKHIKKAENNFVFSAFLYKIC